MLQLSLALFPDFTQPTCSGSGSEGMLGVGGVSVCVSRHIVSSGTGGSDCTVIYTAAMYIQKLHEVYGQI